MLNFEELCLIDDITKFLVIDTHLGLDTKKTEVVDLKKFFKYDHEAISESIKEFLEKVDYPKTISTLITLINKHLPKRSNLFWQCLKENLHNYLNLIDPENSVYTVQESFQYSCLDRQVKIVAEGIIKKNTDIKLLSGFNVPLTLEEENKLSRNKNDFSIMYSSRKKVYSLLLGPVALINHQCNANCGYTSIKEGSVYISAKETIQKGNEITCNYSANYFENNNLLCECQTCIDAKFLFKRELRMIQTQDLLISNSFIKKLIEFKTLMAKITPLNLDGKCQRKAYNNFGKGLAYDNEFYTKFIGFVKCNKIITETTNEPKLQSDEIKSIVDGIYKNWHISSYKAVEKFIPKYFETIKKDVNDYNENVILLAPEFKAMEIYMLNLIITCIMLCHEEFGNCIYKGEKVSHGNKTKILTKMYRNFTKTDQEKLNNALDKYNLYLQSRSRDLVNNVLRHMMLEDIQKKKSIVLLKTLIRQEDSQDSFEDQSSHELRSIDTSRASSDPNCSFSNFTMEDINEIIGCSENV